MTPIKTNSISTDSVCPKTGKLKYGLTNDYMFRAILQSNEYVLRNLIAALLHLEETQIQKVEILNPIKIGESIQDKEFQMDIHILLNDASMMNLEMQVADYGNWKERSLSYMCRGFDNLKKGDDYINVKPIVHVSFLNFSLPDLLPEFYGTYYVMNEKTHQVYSDKLRLSVVNLEHIELATETDKKYHIHEWAALFKATTWEELSMLSEKNEFFREAAESYRSLSEDAQVRYQCEAREDYIHTHANFWKQLEELNLQKQHVNEQKQRIDEQKQCIDEQQQCIDEQQQQIDDQRQLLSEKDRRIAELEKELAESKRTG